jgi:hypothetical protein
MWSVHDIVSMIVLFLDGVNVLDVDAFMSVLMC